nr:unnamed protein product [Callosobruchus analis]
MSNVPSLWIIVLYEVLLLCCLMFGYKKMSVMFLFKLNLRSTIKKKLIFPMCTSLVIISGMLKD